MHVLFLSSMKEFNNFNFVMCCTLTNTLPCTFYSPLIFTEWIYSCGVKHETKCIYSVQRILY